MACSDVGFDRAARAVFRRASHAAVRAGVVAAASQVLARLGDDLGRAAVARRRCPLQAML